MIKEYYKNNSFDLLRIVTNISYHYLNPDQPTSKYSLTIAYVLHSQFILFNS